MHRAAVAPLTLARKLVHMLNSGGVIHAASAVILPRIDRRLLAQSRQEVDSAWHTPVRCCRCLPLEVANRSPGPHQRLVRSDALPFALQARGGLRAEPCHPFGLVVFILAGSRQAGLVCATYSPAAPRTRTCRGPTVSQRILTK